MVMRGAGTASNRDGSKSEEMEHPLLDRVRRRHDLRTFEYAPQCYNALESRRHASAVRAVGRLNG